MPTITTKDGTEIYYKDWGDGEPVVFSHGWPLSADAFEDQMMFLSSHGYRCIAHDRRGHGRSERRFPLSRHSATTSTGAGGWAIRPDRSISRQPKARLAAVATQ